MNENIVEKSGALFSYHDEKIGQCRENSKEYLKKNPAIMAEIEGQVREKYGLPKDEFEAAAGKLSADAAETAEAAETEGQL